MPRVKNILIIVNAVGDDVAKDALGGPKPDAIMATLRQNIVLNVLKPASFR